MKKLIAVAMLSVVAVNASAGEWGDLAAAVIKGTTKILLEGRSNKNSESSQSSPTAVVTATPVPAIPYNALRCRVVGISDGDTFTCLDITNTQIKVRMNQIDAPESGQDFGQVAKTTLSDYIYGREVALDATGTDKYGRTLAEVYRIDDAVNVNKLMVQAGMAWAYLEYLSDSDYVNIENQARINRVGLWSQNNAVYPSVYRQIQRENSSTNKKNANTPAYATGTTSKNTSSKSNTSKQSFSQPAQSGKFGSCGTKKTCSAMSSCSEARYFLNTCGVSRLDKDGDGTPCESLCR